MPEQFEKKSDAKEHSLYFGDDSADEPREGFISEYLSSADNFVKQNPITATAIGIAVIGGGIAIASRSRVAASLATRMAPLADDAINLTGKIAGAEAAMTSRVVASEGVALTSKLAATEAATNLTAVERAALTAGETVETRAARLAGNVEFSSVNGGLKRSLTGEAIPDLKRESMQTLKELAAGGDVLDAASASYTKRLSALWNLPRSIQAEANCTLNSVAKQTLGQRALITGEAIDSAAALKEVNALQTLNITMGNPEAIIQTGTKLTVYDTARLEKLSVDLRFRCVPQLGEFLGVSQAEQARCLAIQAQDKSVLIGKIYVREGLATEQAVESAFQTQSAWKGRLAKDLEAFLASGAK